MTTKSQPRGIRNHNPGNIEYNPAVKWQGMVGPEPGEGRFAVFESPAYGIRAIARLLITYQDAHGINTIKGIVNRYAPSTENNTQTYIDHLCLLTGYGSGQAINAHKFDEVFPLIKAIIRHENGVQPYTDAQITKGLVLAGVEPEQRPLQKTRTIKGGQVATVGVAGTAVADVITEASSQLQPLTGYSDYITWAFVGLSLIGIGMMVWARLDDRNKGLR